MTSMNVADARVAARPIKSVQIGLGAMKAGIGGLERYYFDLLRALPGSGTSVRGFVLGDSCEAAGVSSFAAEGTSLFSRWSGLRSAVASVIGDADLVVSHFALNAFGVMDRLGKIPFVIHFHGPWALESAAEGSGKLTVTTKRMMERFVYHRGSRFIVLSQAFGAILEREYGVPSDLIRVIPGGVDIQRFKSVGTRANARHRLDWPGDRPTVVTVRRMVRAKGLENLIAAVDAVRREVPNVLVVIVGTGPLEAQLRQQVRNAGLEPFVRFQGYVAEADLPTVYRAADLFVVPTLTLEGFGLVVVEALACGTPVLVTPIGGLPEVLGGLQSDLVLTSCEPAELARGMVAALTGDMPLPDEAACRSYAERFDWPVVAKRVTAVYGEAVSA
jgi:glycosyltransferase involved in cell wall biosynthesis